MGIADDMYPVHPATRALGELHERVSNLEARDDARAHVRIAAYQAVTARLIAQPETDADAAFDLLVDGTRNTDKEGTTA